MMTKRLTNFIAGKFIEPQAGSEAKYIPVTDPATGISFLFCLCPKECKQSLYSFLLHIFSFIGQEIAQVPCSNENDVGSAVAAGLTAFETWSMTTIKQRTSIMMKFYSLIVQHSEELSELIVAENGKNYTEAMADIAKGNETVEWACGMSQIFAGRILEVSRGIECREVRAPLGVVAAIAPFNFPFMVPMWTIPISLMCGNCVILKPSEKVPMTMQRVIDLFIEAGIPPGVFQVVHGAVEVVNALCGNLRTYLV